MVLVAGVENVTQSMTGQCMKGTEGEGLKVVAMGDISHKKPGAIIVSGTRKSYSLKVNRSNLKCSYFHSVLVR